MLRLADRRHPLVDELALEADRGGVVGDDQPRAADLQREEGGRGERDRVLVAHADDEAPGPARRAPAGGAVLAAARGGGGGGVVAVLPAAAPGGEQRAAQRRRAARRASGTAGIRARHPPLLPPIAPGQKPRGALTDAPRPAATIPPRPGSFRRSRNTPDEVGRPATYLTSTVAPASSSSPLSLSASSRSMPSLTGLGASSTSALASLRPRPVAARTTLMTWIFLSPAAVRTTSTVLDSSSAAPPPSPPPAAGRGRRDGRRGDAELLLERLDALAQLEHGDALELLDPVLGGGSHVLVLLGGLSGVGTLRGVLRGGGGLGRVGVLVALVVVRRGCGVGGGCGLGGGRRLAAGAGLARRAPRAPRPPGSRRTASSPARRRGRRPGRRRGRSGCGPGR